MYARGKTYRARLLVIVTTERERKRLCTPTRSIALRSLIAAKIIARRHFESVDQPPLLLLLIWFTFLLYLKASAIFPPLSLPPFGQEENAARKERAKAGYKRAWPSVTLCLFVPRGRANIQSGYAIFRSMPLAYLEYDPWWRRNERPCACLLLRYTIQLTCENPDGSTRFEIDYRRDTRSDYPSLFIQKPNRTRSSYELLHSAYLYSTCKLFTRRTTVRLSFVWVSFESFRIFIQIYVFVFRSLMFVRRGNE